MNIDHLLTAQGLRSFTEKRRDQHMRDARAYGQLADILARRLRRTPVDGDKPWSARVRAWRVVRHLRAMERASKQAASEAEALNADYQHQVLELPERRQAALEAKENKKDRNAERARRRKGAAHGYVARSLEQSTARFNGGHGDVQDVEVVSEDAVYLEPEPFLRAVGDGSEGVARPRSVRDYFPNDGGRNGGREAGRGGAR
ncbi:hypothetical protein OG216_46855 (plasmid) [Streptomycetaceae bacterium NBC_01309]